MKKHLLALALLSQSFLSCASLESVSLTQIPAKRSKMIKAESSKYVFLGLTFDNDFADEAVRSLSRKCKNGMVKGIMTKYYKINYFIISKHQIDAEGYCIKRT